MVGQRGHNRHLTLFVPPEASGSRLGVAMPAMCGRTYVMADSWAKASHAKGKRCGLCQRFVPGHETVGTWAVKTAIAPRRARAE